MNIPKAFFAISFLFLGTLLTVGEVLAKPSKPKVLVYRGPGGCNSCAAAAALSLKNYDAQIVYVSASKIDKETFENAVLWVQPAGNAITAAKALGEENLALIRDFVKDGGSYLGFCAGAFLADSTVDDHGKVNGLGLLPFGTLDYEVNKSDNIDMTWVNWSGKKRHVFFNGGGTFDLPANLPASVQIIATYAKDNKPATIRTAFGQGRVILTGAHPEAPKAWKERNDLKDFDGQDLDLAEGLVDLALQ